MTSVGQARRTFLLPTGPRPPIARTHLNGEWMKIYGALAVPVAAMILAAPAGATPTNGSLLVPGDIAPGNYWATPTDSVGGYVAVCSDYNCEVEAGMIENYVVQGRTMIPVPGNARMVNVQRVQLTPVG